MAIKIITADERAAEKRNIKGVIFGPHGIGKTSLLWTLDPEKTLFVNIEAGDTCVKDWPGKNTVEVDTWEDIKDVTCVFGGVDLSKRWDQSYSQQHYDYMIEARPDLIEMTNRTTIHFYDSISVASRLAFQWAEGQPESFNKHGEKDLRGTYGLIGREIIQWLTHIQHTKGKAVWVVGGLDETTDDFNRTIWKPQIEGQSSALKLPGIFDQVISMVESELKDDEGKPYRAFVTEKVNPWGYPAKDRSGKLNMMEEPHLGRLMEKINNSNIKPKHLTYNINNGGNNE